MLKLDQTLQRNPDLIHANMGDETVLMSLTNGEYYGMNEVGSKIWALLEEPHTVIQLAEKLATIYDIDKDHCFQDIQLFLGELEKQGIVYLS